MPETKWNCADNILSPGEAVADEFRPTGFSLIDSIILMINIGFSEV